MPSGNTPPSFATPAELADDDIQMILLAMGLKKATATLYEDSRVDEQHGSASNTSGTTSAVSSAAVPAFLSMAIENGAVTSSQSGNTVSFRGNAAGILRAIDKHGLLEIVGGQRDHWFEGLSNLTLSASFDTSRGAKEGDDPHLDVRDRQQLSAWSARVELKNTHARHIRAFWRTASTQGLQTSERAQSDAEALRKVIALDGALGNALAAWVKTTNTSLLNAYNQHKGTVEVTLVCPNNPFCAVLESRLRDIPLPSGDESGDDGQTASVATRVAALAARYSQRMTPKMLAKAVSGVILASELTSDRGLTGTTRSTARLIFAVNTEKVTFTTNAGIGFILPPLGGLTDSNPQTLEVAGQVDIPFGAAKGIGRFVLTGNYKFIHMFNDPVDLASGTPKPDLKGDTDVVQLKLTIPTNGTGLKIPVSLTWANRSELIKEEHVLRANVGVTYDLDSLLARFR